MWACSKANIPLTNIVFIWNPTAIRCPFLIVPDADPPTGICTSQTLEYNTRCTFTCRNGYRLKGSKERVCQLDKSWSGSPTICERMYTRKHIPCHKNYSSQHTLNAAHHGKVGGIPSSLLWLGWYRSSNITVITTYEDNLWKIWVDRNAQRACLFALIQSAWGKNIS